jgi:E3 ubiquitin-protein ligase DOA10
MLRVQTSLTQTQGLSTNLVIYKTVIDLLRLVVTELNKLQAYRPLRGTRWRSWLKLCAKRRKVAGSISDGVTRIFHWPWG